MTYIVINENEIVKAEMERPVFPSSDDVVDENIDGTFKERLMDHLPLMENYEAHLASLPRIPIKGKHKWEVWQEVPESEVRLEDQFWTGSVWWPTIHLVDGKVKPGTKTRIVAIPIQPTSYTKAMQELKNSPLGEAWDNIICVCRGLIRDNPCDCNCKEFYDETLPNERHPNK